MPQIHISVQNKIARAARRSSCIVCGNNDYEIVFCFDGEWSAHDEKTARFIWEGAYYDVPFKGNVCPMPTVVNASEVEIGVYAGTLRTTTPATLSCRRSVRSDPSLPVSEQALKEYDNQAQGAAAEAKNAASEAASAAQSAQQSAERSEQAYEQIKAASEQLQLDTADAQAHAADMKDHAATVHTRYAFTVGTDDELIYMTDDSAGIYTVSGAYRYNNGQNATVYRYPLVDSARITSALWHAHLAQQVLLQASVDGVEWVTLRDNGDQQIGSQYHYELCDVLNLSGADALYIKIADSNVEDGYGGAILADIPVTLDLTHGESVSFALPIVSEQDNGAYLRVIGGKWRTADATTLLSRVRTYSFKVGEATEEKYRLSHSTGTLNATCRFNDGIRFTTYRYHIANAALVRRVTWTANVGQQLLLECSCDGENWKTLCDAGATTLPFTRTTYDLTELVNLLAFDEIYIRVSDSEPSDGFGGAIQMSGSVDLHVERCEPPIAM